MLFGLLLVLVLGGTLLAYRTGVSGAAEGAWSGGASRRAVWLGAGFVLVGGAPLLLVAPWVHGGGPVFFGDSASHAQVARDIARYGLPNGWLDTYLGGFPFGHHYPPLGWLLLAGAIRAGLSPALAVHTLGWLAMLAAPLALYAGLVRAGGKPAIAALGGLCLGWVSPYNPFVGGYEAFFTTGLVSQVLALPLCLALGGAIAAGGALESALVAALAVATHPELTLATLLVGGIAALVSGRRDAWMRLLRAAAGSLALGLALYGQGLLTLEVPFGWPPAFGWRQLGFGARRFDRWFLDGELFDYDAAAPVITALAGAALVVVALRWRRPTARAALVAVVSALLLSACGPMLARSGAIGRVLLVAVQPLRVLALLPPLAATLLAVALEEAAPVLAATLKHARRERVATHMTSTLVASLGALLCLAVPGRIRALDVPAKMLARSSGSACPGPQIYAPDPWRSELRALQGGRLWFSQREGSELGICFERDGLTLESGVPLGTTTAVGSHLGLEWLAAQQLEPGRPGALRRAEALGVRHLVLPTDAAVPSGFALRSRHHAVALVTSLAPTDLAGAGCITERWRGTDSALRARLGAELATPNGADRLLDPQQLVALEAGPSDAVATATSPEGCDASAARVTSRSPEPGVLEASVETNTPVELVLRVTWFPTWHVTLDGEPVRALAKVAPGYPALRVPAGRHSVEARVSPLPGYGWLVLAGWLGVAAAGASSRELWLKALRRAPGRSSPPS